MQELYSVGIYARLSRDDKHAGESISIENQKDISPGIYGNRAGRSTTTATVTIGPQIQSSTVRDSTGWCRTRQTT